MNLYQLSDPVLILRGIPGAGKSTLVRNLRDSVTYQFAVHSADHEFIGTDGESRFNAERLDAAHTACFRKAIATMGDMMPGLESSVEQVIIDNTNCTIAEVTPYVMLAKAHGLDYRVVTLSVSNADVEAVGRRNVHGVPMQVIRNMHRTMSGEVPPRWMRHTYLDYASA